VYTPAAEREPKLSVPPEDVIESISEPVLKRRYFTPDVELLSNMFVDDEAPAQKLALPETVNTDGAGVVVMVALPVIVDVQPVPGFVARTVYVPAVMKPKLSGSPLPATAVPEGVAPLNS